MWNALTAHGRVVFAPSPRGRCLMPPLPNRPPRNSSSINRMIRRNPALFGVPFIALIVGGSFGLQHLTQIRYDVHDRRTKKARLTRLSTRPRALLRVRAGDHEGGAAAREQEEAQVRYSRGILRAHRVRILSAS